MSSTRADIIIRMQAEQAKREGRELSKRMAELERELKGADRASQKVDREFSQLAASTARADAAAGRFDGALAAVKTRLNAAERGSVEYQRALLQQTQIQKQAEQAGRGMLDSLKGMALGSAAVVGAGLVSYFNNLRAAGQQARLGIEQARLQLTVFLGGQEQSNKAFQDGARFAQRYGYTQAEVASALQSSALILQKTNQPADKLLETLGRLGQLNIAEGIDGAAYALRELLSGDITSVVERFNISRDAARELRDAIASGQDPVLALDAALNKLGATNAILEARTKGAAGAQNELKKAQEDLALATDQLLGEDAWTRFQTNLAKGTTLVVNFFDEYAKGAEKALPPASQLISVTNHLTAAEQDAARANEMAAYWTAELARQEQIATFATGELTTAQRDQAVATLQASAEAELLALRQQQVEMTARNTAAEMLRSGEAGRIQAAQYAVSGDANLRLAATYYEVARAAAVANLTMGAKDAGSAAVAAAKAAVAQKQIDAAMAAITSIARTPISVAGPRVAGGGGSSAGRAGGGGAAGSGSSAPSRSAEQDLRDQEREAERLQRAKYELLSTTEKLIQKQREYAAATNEADRAELLGEIRDLEKEIADEKERQVDAAISLQQALVKNAQQGLDDLKRAEQARKVLDSSTASAEQKARARLALQEIAANQAARKEEIGDLQQAAGKSPAGTGARGPVQSIMPIGAPSIGQDAARHMLMRGSTPLGAPALGAGMGGGTQSAMGGGVDQTLVVQLTLDGEVVAEQTFPHLAARFGSALRAGRSTALAAGTRRR